MEASLLLPRPLPSLEVGAILASPGRAALARFLHGPRPSAVAEPEKKTEEPSPLLQTRDLLAEVRAGRSEAQEELFERYGPLLRQLLHGRLPQSARGMQETQDLVQEVCLQALRTLDRFEYRGVGSFWWYLRRIALNRLNDVYRGSRAATSLEGLTEEDPAQDPPALERSLMSGLVAREHLEIFERSLERLSDKNREALVMRLELDMSYRSIAEECGYPTEDAARAAIKRALRKVYEEMKRGGAGE